MKTKYIIGASLALAASLAQAQERPNIIVFLVDDMGLMDTSLPFITDANGTPQKQPLNNFYHTPNMERLAQQGIRFSRFYAQSVSSPTRATIMTGQNSARNHTTQWIKSESNNRGTYGPKDWNWLGIRKNTVTLPKMLRKVGYETIHVGKAHFGPFQSVAENPLNVGFDVNIAGCSIGQPGSYYGEWGYGNLKGNKARAVPGLEKYFHTHVFLSEALTLEANAQIEEAVEAKKPFYLYMAHYALHAPFQTDKRFLYHYPKNKLPMGGSDKTQAFATLVEGMDQSLGEMMNWLDGLGVAENTLIIFLGDNGSDAPLGHTKGYGSSAPLRGKKGTEYEGGVRVPFIAAWAKPDPTNKFQQQLPIPQNAVQQQLGTVMDIFPTVLAVAGAQDDANHIKDGVDLHTQLLGQVNETRTNAVLMHFPHEHRGSYFTSYIEDDWKVIYRYHPENPKHPGYELYNLKKDPTESTDLASSEKSILKEMVQKMAAELIKEDAQYPIDAAGHSLKPIIP